jgi:hypothetical protein
VNPGQCAPGPAVAISCRSAPAYRKDCWPKSGKRNQTSEAIPLMSIRRRDLRQQLPLKSDDVESRVCARLGRAIVHFVNSKQDFLRFIIRENSRDTTAERKRDRELLCRYVLATKFDPVVLNL